MSESNGNSKNGSLLMAMKNMRFLSPHTILILQTQIKIHLHKVVGKVEVAIQVKKSVRSPVSRLNKWPKQTHMIRGFALYTVNAFKQFGAAKVEEVNFSFGLTLGGKAGIPYITEGSAESNVTISVKCTFPDEQKSPQQPSQQDNEETKMNRPH